jgi:hypothetical protein
MLTIEETRNGQRIVVVKKDWHPGRIGRAYQRPLPNYVMSKDALNLQRAFLRKQS